MMFSYIKNLVTMNEAMHCQIWDTWKKLLLNLLKEALDFSREQSWGNF